MGIRREGCAGLIFVCFLHLDIKIETTHTDCEKGRQISLISILERFI